MIIHHLIGGGYRYVLSGRRAMTVGMKVLEVTLALMMKVCVQSDGVILNVASCSGKNLEVGIRAKE